MLKKNSIELRVLYIFFMLLPLDYYITNVIFKNNSLIALWKELFILIIVLCALINVFKNNQLKFNKSMIVMGIFAWYLIILTLVGDYPTAALAAWRTYVEPLLLYVAIINIPTVSGTQYFSLLRAITIEFGIISLYGLFQAFVLGQTFLENQVFRSNILDNSFYIAGNYGILRVNGTFVSPLDFALYASLLLILRVSTYSNFKFNILEILSLVMIFGALLATVTRSAIISFMIAMFIYVIQKNRILGILKVSLFSLIVIIILMILDSKFFNSIITRQILSSITSTLSGADPSAMAHKNAVSEGFFLLGSDLAHWLTGIGLGKNGPRAYQFFSDPNLVESSYYLMIFESGILGLIIYIVIFIFFYLKKSTTLYNDVVRYLVIVLMVSFIFLPFVQSLPPMLFFFGIIALISQIRET